MLTASDLTKLTDLIRFLIKEELAVALQGLATKESVDQVRTELNELKDTVVGIRYELDTEHALRHQVVVDHEGRITWLEQQIKT